MVQHTLSSDDARVYQVSWNSLQSFRSCDPDKWIVNRQTYIAIP